MVRVLGIGDNTVDIYVDQDVQFPGGNAVNIAVLTKRLGADAGYLGCIGTDFLGDIVRDGLVAEGIDISHLRVVDGPNSWSRIRHVDGDRYFDGNHPSMRDDYKLVAGDFDYIASFDIAHSSVYSKLEHELERIGAAAPILSFDYSSEYDGAYIAETAPHLDIAFLSVAGASDQDCRSLAREVEARGPRLVILTRGARGALAFDGSAFTAQAVLPTEIVDTLGAGDGFIAGFLISHLSGDGLAASLQRGAEVASKVCAYRGAFGYETPIRRGQPGLVKPDKKP